MVEETPRAAPAQEMYLISGFANEQFDIATLRDRIRSGELTPEEEISLAGSDIWKPASQYPALTRYFSLVAQRAGATATPMVHASRAAAPPAGSRYFAGLLYPFTSVTTVVFIALGFATTIKPLLSIPVSALASVFGLAIIRRSADGETRAPELNAEGGVVDWIVDFLRLFAIALVSAWPMFLAVLLLLFTNAPWGPVTYGAALVTILYYPACRIGVARWKSVAMALSIKEIFGLISALGAAYYGAVAVFMVLVIGEIVATTTFRAALGLRFALALRAVTTIFMVFYLDHLLGWAVYRRRDYLE